MAQGSDRKAETHRRIIDEAAQRFRRDGIEATSVQGLMQALGLTHGGFYAHFSSKRALVEAVLADFASQRGELVREMFSHEDGLVRFVNAYISVEHQDRPEAGCCLPNVCAELGRQGAPSATTDAIFEALIETLAGHLGDSREASVWLSAAVGALVLARSLCDTERSERLLAATREGLLARMASGEHSMAARPSPPSA